MSSEENFEHDDAIPEDDEPSAGVADPALAEHVERSLKKLGEEIADMKRRGV